VAFYRRSLPHWQPEDKDLFVTWRLEGTLPPNRRVAPESLTAGQAFATVDRLLDKASYGPSWLRKPEIAHAVVVALHHHQDKLRHYNMHAYVVMPNHVHLLITPLVAPPTIMQSLKGFSARDANLMLDRTGLPFWQRESYDHWLREGEFERIREYIERNPVKAGLASAPHLFPWSSASRRQVGSPAGLPAPQSL
jgi:putative transposase